MRTCQPSGLRPEFGQIRAQARAVGGEERAASSGFSSKRLTRVREVFSRHLDAGYVPGAVAVVARHGEVHIEAMGNLAFGGEDSRTPMAADTISRIGSMTKPVGRGSAAWAARVRQACGRP